MNQLKITYNKNTVKIYKKYIEVLDPNTNLQYKIKFKWIRECKRIDSCQLYISKYPTGLFAWNDYEEIYIKFNDHQISESFYNEIKNIVENKNKESEENPKKITMVLAIIFSCCFLGFCFLSCGDCSGGGGNGKTSCKNCGRNSVYSMGFCKSCYESFYEFTYGKDD